MKRRVIVVGGSVGEDGKSCEAFDLLTKKWSCIASLNKDYLRASAVSDGHAVYVFGDITGFFEQYDATADKWTLLTTEKPVKQTRFAVACVNSNIYLLGGLLDYSITTESFVCLKPDRRRYLTKASLPVACHDQCAVSADVSDKALFEVLLPLL